MMTPKKQKNILWFKDVRKKDVALVGGKNASLGEMYSQLTKKGIYLVKSRKAGIPLHPVKLPSALFNGAGAELFNRVNIPNGFALTARAYWYFLKFNAIDKKLKEIFQQFNPKSIKSLQETGKKARQLILKGEFPEDLKKEILKNYKRLSKEYVQENTDVAVRSSATAEDLKTASFAGQMETYLNVRSGEELLRAIRKCMASLFNDRVIAYREEKGFSHLKIALSVGVQKMVRSDLACSGVMFTLDTETGFENVVLINSIWGIGEMIVKGRVTPDEFYVFKPTLKQGYKSIIVKNLGRKTKKYIYPVKSRKAGISPKAKLFNRVNDKNQGIVEVTIPKTQQLKFSLTDEEILTLARWAMAIEKHYKSPQDIEWAKDGKTGQLFIVQSRPETIHAPQKIKFYEEYKIKTKKKPLLEGIAIGSKIGMGKVRIIPNVSKLAEFQKGEVLVTKMTDPDWLPVMRIASGIITDEGGKTAHAAIVSRELGLPCIVGTQKATKTLKTGQTVTVDCTQGLNGRIFGGKISFEIKRYNLKKLPWLKTKIMVNIGAPEIAFKTSFLPVEGVGLAREEFIIAEKIRVHPLALYHYKKLKSQISNLKSTPKENLRFPTGQASQISKLNLNKIIKQIEKVTVEHKNKKEYFIKELAEGVAQIAAAFYPREVILRFSDFKTNEYAQLIGGELFEPEEENPMLGWRGASRYYDERFKPAFLMEIEAIKRVRNIFGLKNVSVMIPFCRTVEEGEKVLQLIKKAGLEKGKDGLKVYVMAEIPSNIILAEEFLDIFDGASLGTNDLLQTTLGIDRDNAQLSKIADETNEAVKREVVKIIKLANKKGKYSGICGDIPSTDIEFAWFLVKEGIESMSLSPDAVIKTILGLAKKQ